VLSVHRQQSGFTLIEIAIAILLIGLLSVGITTFSRDNSSYSKIKKTILTAKQVESVLHTYLLINKHLPCPDSFSSADGLENRDGDGSCSSRKGYLPTVTLNINAQDAWRNPFFYQVNARAEQASRVTNICESASVFGKSGVRTKPGSFGQCSDTKLYYCKDCSDACNASCDFVADPRADDVPPYFHLSTRPFGAEDSNSKNLYIHYRSENEPKERVINETAVAVVISFGNNGTQTWHSLLNNGGVCSATEITNSSEFENCDGDVDFMVSENKPAEDHLDNNVIDDYVVWLDLYEIKREAAKRGFFE
jgi:prepilin-type N-terminal cleavage/methylation domain-containing protein